MKVERVSKDPGGHYVVEATRNATIVAGFQLLDHEIGSITCVINFPKTNHPVNYTECHVQYAMSTNRRVIFNKIALKLLDFALEHQNPYSVIVNVPVPLHSPLTK